LGTSWQLELHQHSKAEVDIAGNFKQNIKHDWQRERRQEISKKMQNVIAETTSKASRNQLSVAWQDEFQRIDMIKS
jgi:hypothetical protein